MTLQNKCLPVWYLIYRERGKFNYKYSFKLPLLKHLTNLTMDCEADRNKFYKRIDRTFSLPYFHFFCETRLSEFKWLYSIPHKHQFVSMDNSLSFLYKNYFTLTKFLPSCIKTSYLWHFILLHFSFEVD